MVTSDPSAMVNAGICAVIVLVLMFYQREGARHRPAISLLAYFVVLVYASVPFRYLFGLYRGVTLDGGHRKHSYLRCRLMGSWERGASC